MHLFGFQLIAFFVFLVADIVFYFILRSPSFPIEDKGVAYEIFAILIDPVFIGGILFGLNALRKNHPKMAFFLIMAPLVMTGLFYMSFR